MTGAVLISISVVCSQRRLSSSFLLRCLLPCIPLPLRTLFYVLLSPVPCELMWTLKNTSLLYSALFTCSESIQNQRSLWIGFKLTCMMMTVLIKKSSETSKCTTWIWELKFTLLRLKSYWALNLINILFIPKLNLLNFFSPAEGPSSRQEVAVMSAAHRAVLRGPFYPERFVFIGQRLPSLKVPSQSFDLLWSPLPRLLNWDFCPRYPPKLGPNVYTYMSLKSRETTANECILRKRIILLKFCGYSSFFYTQKLWLQRQSLDEESSRKIRAAEVQLCFWISFTFIVHS